MKKNFIILIGFISALSICNFSFAGSAPGAACLTRADGFDGLVTRPSNGSLVNSSGATQEIYCPISLDSDDPVANAGLTFTSFSGVVQCHLFVRNASGGALGSSFRSLADGNGSTFTFAFDPVPAGPINYFRCLVPAGTRIKMYFW